MYAIKAWNDIFENNRSRQLNEPTYVNWPVRRDSEGFASLMRDAKGMAAFGLFGALVQWLGRQPVNMRRSGALADDKGEMTPDRFAVRMGAPVRDVRAAWDRLVSIGWLVTVTTPSLERHQNDAEVTPERPHSDGEVTALCAGAERSGEERKGLERSGVGNDADDDTDEGGGEARKGIAHGHPPARPPAKARHSPVDDLRGVESVRAALEALRIDGAALDGLSVAPTLTLEVLRATVEEIERRANVRNPKRLLVSVLCERHGVKIEKGANVRIGMSDIAGALAKFEEIKRQKFSAGGAR